MFLSPCPLSVLSCNYGEVDERRFGALPRGREIVLKYSRIFETLR